MTRVRESAEPLQESHEPIDRKRRSTDVGCTAPNVFHFVWLGGALPSDRATNIAAWEERTGATVILWLDMNSAKATQDYGWETRNISELAEGNERFAKAIQKFPTVVDKKVNGPAAAALSDVARLEILRQFGGTYMDSDNKPGPGVNEEFSTKPMPHGFRLGSVDKGSNMGVSNDAITALADSKFIATWLDLLYQGLDDKQQVELINDVTWRAQDRRDAVMGTTGPYAMQNIDLDSIGLQPTAEAVNQLQQAVSARLQVEAEFSTLKDLNALFSYASMGADLPKELKDLLNEVTYGDLIRECGNAWVPKVGDS